MNIFATSKCPVESAGYLDDKRVIKMVSESAQMLCHVVGFYGHESYGLPVSQWNHPVVKWLDEDISNQSWLYRHFIALLDQFALRRGKLHDAEKLRNILHPFFNAHGSSEPSSFKNCAANESKGVSFKHEKDVHLAYRLYLNERWKTDKIQPKWFGNN